MRRYIILATFLLALPGAAQAMIPVHTLHVNMQSSDGALYNLAVQHKVVSWSTRAEYVARRGGIPTNNLKNWFIMSPDEKLAVIKLYQQWLYDNAGIVIQKPAEFYVQLFNFQLYNLVAADQWTAVKNYNTVGFLQMLAGMERDLRDVRSISSVSQPSATHPAVVVTMDQ